MKATIIDEEYPSNPKLYQWDTGRKISIEGNCTYVDYVVKGVPECFRVEVNNNEASIPNTVLTFHGMLTIMLVKENTNKHKTVHQQTTIINKREKPDEYIFSEGDYRNWEWIRQHAIQATQDAEVLALQHILEAKNAVDDLKDDAETAAQNAQNEANRAQGYANRTEINTRTAYEIAVKNGFTGTEQQWLASLVGPQGGIYYPEFTLDPDTGMLSVTGDDLSAIDFTLNENGHLEVIST